MAKQAASPKRAPAEEGRQLFTFREAAAYLGPSFTDRWVKRQVHDAKTIKSIRLTDGRTVIARAELDRFVDEQMAKTESR
jgi:hypothetical protein